MAWHLTEGKPLPQPMWIRCLMPYGVISPQGDNKIFPTFFIIVDVIILVTLTPFLASQMSDGTTDAAQSIVVLLSDDQLHQVRPQHLQDNTGTSHSTLNALLWFGNLVDFARIIQGYFSGTEAIILPQCQRSNPERYGRYLITCGNGSHETNIYNHNKTKLHKTMCTNMELLGRVCGWMDGWIDGWMDRWMDGWILTPSIHSTVVLSICSMFSHIIRRPSFVMYSGSLVFFVWKQTTVTLLKATSDDVKNYLIINWYLHVRNGVAVAAYSRLASRSQAKFHTMKLSPLHGPCAAAPAQSTTYPNRSLDFCRATSSQRGRWVGSWPLLLHSVHEDTI